MCCLRRGNRLCLRSLPFVGAYPHPAPQGVPNIHEDGQLLLLLVQRPLAGLLNAIPGVVEHGLFIDLASIAVLAGGQGIRVVERR